MNCQQCGAHNEAHAQYCDLCGTMMVRPMRVATATTSFRAPDDVIAAEPVRLADVKANGNDREGRGEAVSIGAYGTSWERRTREVEEINENNSTVASPHAKLVIQRGESAGKSFLMREDEAYIGRWDADGGIFPDVDLDADDPEAKVSRRHARVIRRADGYFVEDLGSTNGTFVNRGRRLLPGSLQPLSDGDEIIVGKTFLRLYIIG